MSRYLKLRGCNFSISSYRDGIEYFKVSQATGLELEYLKVSQATGLELQYLKAGI